MAVDEKKVVEVLKNNLDSSSIRLVAMVTYLDGEAVGRNNVLLPLENLEQLREFFATWEVSYEVRKFVELE